MQPCYYLAYGSNLHPLRLKERIPSCEFLHTIKLTGYQLLFHKRASDNSGKCNIIHTGDDSQYILAAIYVMDSKDKLLLDKFEGVGYITTSRQLTIAGNLLDVFWYIATDDHIDNELQPYCWYKELVVLGASFHQFPDIYIETLKQFDFIKDPDQQRREKHYELIDRINNYGHG